MELSRRLEMILENIDECNCVLDVGTDHGYIPIEVIKRKISKKAIASDINKDPLDKAKLNSIFEGVDEEIELRLGSGLDTIKKNEVDSIVIAGMGGNLIKEILENGKNKIKEAASIILLPAQNPEVLREYLYANGYEIIKEDLCVDEDIYYELFKVRINESSKTELEKIYYEISPVLLRDKNPLMKEFIEEKINKYTKISNLIEDDSENAIKRKEELTDKVNILENMMKYC
ncbi:class I SAM-dependent methyltransferase [uncultured Clostridium sp.]|uniref:tRNA (adenine(22)-N(1))-methyltransferase n=1 Tax=uncultured Clostridium sp. TaxID=59620 RepID=UPI00262E5D7E|nr:class I SAM-dependent methyltransferase [uncultured Clostridium sp.]